MNNSIPTTQTSRPHRRGFTLAELATAMGLLLQILAARLGVVTGKNLAEVPRRVGSPAW